jgi:hypothetical protein
MSTAIPGNIFDDSVPISPGHLPGISTIVHDVVVPKSSAEESVWRKVHYGRKNDKRWHGNKE